MLVAATGATMKTIYTKTDWAEFFMFAASGQIEEAKVWLTEYSRTHSDLRNTDDEEKNIAIKEAVSFLEKFAKNWNDSILKQEIRQARQKKLHLSRSSTEREWNPNDPQFW